MGYIRRNIFKKQTVIVFLLFMGAVTWFIHNILASVSQRKVHGYFDGSEDYSEEFFDIGDGNGDDDDDVFRLGSSLLRSGGIDGDDSESKMKRENKEVPIVFVDQHQEGKTNTNLKNYMFPLSISLFPISPPSVNWPLILYAEDVYIRLANKRNHEKQLGCL